MRNSLLFNGIVRRGLIGVFLAGLCALSISCNGPGQSARRGEPDPAEAWPKWPATQASWQEQELAPIYASLPVVEGAEYINDDELCLTCHQTYTESFQNNNVHRGLHQEGQSCEACHGPGSRHLETRGKEPGTLINFKSLAPAQASEVCLQCHEQNACSPGGKWRTSQHAHACLTCINCHQGHYDLPPGTPATTEPNLDARTETRSSVQLASLQEPGAFPSLAGTSNAMGALTPNVCYQCHGDKADMQDIAGPHQIGGINCFNCNTCHDPHGKIVEYSRKDLCLECHQQGSPTMAYHSSTHALFGVACTDCHNPHPSANVTHVVGISHFDVTHNNRLPMSVDDPGACFKCHPQVFANMSLPSHHPVKEGKMRCGDCHDGHGQMEGNLRAETLNLLCWKCHAEKQGPFAYEHPPVTEDCGICHSPHGTVANNLLKQPPAFLCLRCHVGHRQWAHGSGDRVDIDGKVELRQAFYSDCSQCHNQIHGSDLPASHSNPGAMTR